MIRRESCMNLDQIVPSLLVPGWIACVMAVLAGVIKIIEYRRVYDWTVIVSIISRFVIGFVFLVDPEVLTPRVILLRFALVMLFLSENARRGLKIAGRRYKRHA